MIRPVKTRGIIWRHEVYREEVEEICRDHIVLKVRKGVIVGHVGFTQTGRAAKGPRIWHKRHTAKVDELLRRVGWIGIERWELGIKLRQGLNCSFGGLIRGCVWRQGRQFGCRVVCIGNAGNSELDQTQDLLDRVLCYRDWLVLNHGTKTTQCRVYVIDIVRVFCRVSKHVVHEYYASRVEKEGIVSQRLTVRALADFFNVSNMD